MNLGIAAIVLALVIFLLPKLVVFFLPFVIGWIIALIASPFVRFFEEKVKIRRKIGSAFVIIVVIGLVVLVLYLIGYKLVNELIDFIDGLPGLWQSMEKDFHEIGQNLGSLYEKLPQNVQESLSGIAERANVYAGELLSQISNPAIMGVGNFAKQLPTVIIGIIMCLLSAYFFVADRSLVNEWCRGHMPQSLQYRYRIMRKSLVYSVGGYLKAQLKIEVWMYVLLVIGLSILRVNYTLLIALGIAIMDFLPFFGTGTIMVPWAVIKILSADYQMAVGLLIIWGVGQLVRQIIQPKIVGDSVGVPPIPTLFLLFIGYRLGGVFGMIVAVPFGLILFSMYEEGAFDTTRNSLKILVTGINRFRRIEPEDMQEVIQQEKESRGKREIQKESAQQKEALRGRKERNAE